MPPPTYQGTVLITGGTSGLGLHCATSIARKHPEYQIIVASRSDPHKAAETINKRLSQSNTDFLPLDLSSLGKVRSFALKWAADKLPPIRSLVLNAAIQFPGEPEYTQDGFETTFAVSHLGHALLVSLLRPFFADDVRISVVSSSTHDPEVKTRAPGAHYASAEELAHPTLASSIGNGIQRYSNTKLANILYAYALRRRLEQVNIKRGKNWTINAFDPGLMPGTGLARNRSSAVLKFLWLHILPRITPLLRLLLSPNIHTSQESGESLAWLAVSTEVSGRSGVYYQGRKALRSSKASYDESKQEDLWKFTADTLCENATEVTAFNFQDLL